jgi:eukaryotic-like serine/threonine-protein kinase
MSVATRLVLQPGAEPIPGYILRDRIGSGGFGEVWRADAPGGLQKAVKVIHGHLDAGRAARERRSLERLRGVHHPFLLTLERFEVVDGRLVVVSELADGSLDDVVARLRQQGSCGIPRQELLGYLHDAADALDYLHQRYGLQHLDVKPGNMLMIGGHVKVADFGLVKHLDDVECSLVGGLTPAYAAPELFDGKPSAFSDQYSLAIVYQELLVGRRPFGGRTMAQLATQHVHGAPDLEPLPASDRPVVARALEKVASRRWDSCREFIERLRSSPRRSTTVVSPGVPRNANETHAATAQTTFMGVRRIASLPKLNDSAQSLICANAMVIGIGGVGAAVLTQVRDQLSRQPGAPNCHMLLLDTDIETLGVACRGRGVGRLETAETLHLPLRSPHDYRAEGLSLRSVSRRWLFNIPRSLQTEGLRPLGRLALLASSQKAMEYLREYVKAVAAVPNETQHPPRIYVAASLCGGTGSGMALDVIHVLRHLLDDHGLAEARLMPVFLAAPLATDHRHPLATADSYAALHELIYFCNAGNSYPGDVDAGLPSVPAARSPLRDAYVLSPRGIEAAAWLSSIEQAAHYIATDAGPTGGILAAARKGEAESDLSAMREPTIRTFGAVPIPAERMVTIDRVSKQLSLGLLDRWTTVREGFNAVKIEQLAERVLVQSNLQPKKLVESWLVQAFETTAADIEVQLGHMILGQLRTGDSRATTVAMSSVMQVIDSTLQAIFGGTEGVTLEPSFRAAIDRLPLEFSRLLEEDRLDLATTEQVRGILRPMLTRLITEDEQSLRAATTELQKLIAEHARKYAAIPAAPALLPNNHPAVRIASLSLRVASMRLVLRSLSKWLEANPEIVPPIGHRKGWLLQLRSMAANAWSTTIGKPLDEFVAASIPKLLDQLHQSLAPVLLGEPLPSEGPTQSWMDRLQDAAAEVLRGMISSAELPSNALGGEWCGGDGSSADIQRRLQQLDPPLLACGGKQRLIFIVGSEEQKRLIEPIIARWSESAVSTFVIQGHPASLIHEAQSVPISGVMNRLLEAMGSDPSIARRLASRSDIEMGYDGAAL